MFFKEGLHFRCKGISLGYLFVHPVGQDIAGGVPLKAIVDKAREIPGTFVAVPFHPFDPLGV